MMLKRYSALFLSIIGMLSACESSEFSQPEKNANKAILRLGMAMQPTSALLIIAEKKGFFQQQGLELEVVQFPSGKRALYGGLLNDEVDVISLNESPFVMAAFKYDELRTLSSIFIDDNTNSIVSRRDAGVQFPADLKDKKIATQKASAVHYFMHQFLIENGIEFDQIDIEFYKAEELVSKLVKGKIDAFSMREPYTSEAKLLLKEKAIVFEEEGIYTQLGLLVAKEDYIIKNRQLVLKMLRALKQAEKYFVANKQQSLKIIAVYLGTEYKTFSESFGQTEVKLSLDQLYISVSEDIARWAIFKGYADAENMPNFLEKVVSSPLREIAPEAVTLIDKAL